MTDISKCTGMCKGNKECPVREKCYRYLAIDDKYWQSYMAGCYDFDEDICENYWKVSTISEMRRTNHAK